MSKVRAGLRSTTEDTLLQLSNELQKKDFVDVENYQNWIQFEPEFHTEGVTRVSTTNCQYQVQQEINRVEFVIQTTVQFAVTSVGLNLSIPGTFRVVDMVNVHLAWITSPTTLVNSGVGRWLENRLSIHQFDFGVYPTGHDIRFLIEGRARIT